MTTLANQRSVDGFNDWARTYESDRIAGFFQEMQSRVVRHLDLGPDARLLDVGCGTGWAVEFAVRQAGVGEAVGVDLSPEMVAQARARRAGVDAVSFECADAEELPFADDTFDAAMCTYSFHHYSSPVTAMQEIRRVLKPEGTFCILDNDRSSLLGLYVIWDWYFRWFEPGHVRYLTGPELEAYFRQGGFRDVETVFRLNRLFYGSKVFGSGIMVCGQK